MPRLVVPANAVNRRCSVKSWPSTDPVSRIRQYSIWESKYNIGKNYSRRKHIFFPWLPHGAAISWISTLFCLRSTYHGHRTHSLVRVFRHRMRLMASLRIPQAVWNSNWLLFRGEAIKNYTFSHSFFLSISHLSSHKCGTGVFSQTITAYCCVSIPCLSAHTTLSYAKHTTRTQHASIWHTCMDSTIPIVYIYELYMPNVNRVVGTFGSRVPFSLINILCKLPSHYTQEINIDKA